MDIAPSVDEILLSLQLVMFQTVVFLSMCSQLLDVWIVRKNSKKVRYNLRERIPDQVKHLTRIINICDSACIKNLRMSRNAFGRLCYLIEDVGGLVPSRHVSISEQVAMFLHVLSHHTKNRKVGHSYQRSGRTVSKYFNSVLNCIIKLHPLLIAYPKPVDDGCQDERWKYFKGCLGALDGTYIKVRVPMSAQGRYRNRKGEISVNVLGVCDQKLNFIYILSGWEGSATDSRVLGDALSRNNGLRVPSGNYYLCDNGYTNEEGFLNPYKSVRYHLDEWVDGNRRPQNKEEYFNMKHSKARNAVERSFGLLKTRWAIMRTPSHYPIKTQNRIIMACALLHNFIRTVMDVDPIEDLVPKYYEEEGYEEPQYVDVVESTPPWSLWRDNLAMSMYNGTI